MVLSGKYALIGLDKDLLDSLGQRVCAIFDPNETGDVWGVPVIGADDCWPSWKKENPGVRPILAIDLPSVRKKLYQHYGEADVASFASKHAYVSQRCSLGLGCTVQQNAYLSADVSLGVCVRVNIGAQIHHDCRVSPFVTLAPHCQLMGNVSVGEGSYIGANATVLQGVNIGSNVTVGAGCVVTKDIPDNVTVFGIPGKIKGQ